MCDVVKFPANITARIPITVPKDTTKATPLCPTNFKAQDNASPTFKLVYEVTPVKTKETAMYIIVHITKELISPSGKDFCGFLTSSAAEAVASNPQ